ncbi:MULTISPECIES: D-glycero-beta-D-manno-heptose 1-phosphate adenylyltransferase [Persicobacter]|uniref:D-glycero-beta-D-manno-heptose 1-phosphate adenylyltransferase n=1 Tax=Persicobacter diffluens TaxID=981 RepID=A0AAN5AKW9_9BACT|nr:D-glycero-beta-D-manno-heptose 1-phosphate adenylyltransferase [Persicobacter sp. CCB-QB2]GJM62247.1 cytidylyltransferase [Persicobacter diffluens]
MKTTADKIISWSDIDQTMDAYRQKGEKIVFSNGCFDILHLGHIDYLEKSRQKGDRLVIGLNTDASVQKLKGPERPINNEYSRARMLAALAFVDNVILFGEQTPLKLIETVKPDILVKGNDYSVENIVGAPFVLENGGSVETVDLVDGFSTTNIIDKIKKFG